MVHKISIKKVQNELTKEFSPKAIGIFGSGAKEITLNSDVDLYVLKEHLPRRIIRDSGLIFEIYFEDPINILNAISLKEVRIIDRFRNSKPIYDPNGIYQDLINCAKKQNLKEDAWKEQTIIGGDYDLVERTSINVRKGLEKNDLESAILSIQYLMDRIIELGFRRLDISEYANPKKISYLINYLPEKTEQIYKKVKFSDIREIGLIKEIMKDIEKNKSSLLPPLK
ncbi:hypothetical protein GYA25_00415 [Candidatus Woesearchaeota archaeon]|nr:hypothetical protein [Candidatus Woesearchaeota archaeon]